MTLDDLPEILAASGARLNVLLQDPDGVWRVSLRSHVRGKRDFGPGFRYALGFGGSPSAAIAVALRRFTEPLPVSAPSGRIDISLEDLDL